MTIQTRMSYPEGGSECPPEESPVPGSPSSMATSSDGTVLGHTRPADDGSSSSSSSANQSNKGKVVPNQQKSKVRNLKPLPLPDAKPNDPSSEETANMNNNSIDKDNQCTKCTRSLAGNVKVEDLKKPSKARSSPEGGEGKEEAASRKSMRLRMKRRNPADDPFVSKKLPRYVEDLNKLNFDDEKQKVQFMHTLGMSFTPNKRKMESQLSPDPVVSLGPEKASEEKVLGSGISPVLAKCDKGAGAEAKMINTKFNKCDAIRGPETVGPSLSPEANAEATKPKSKPRDENSDWVNWVKRVLSRDKKPETRSPTTLEINDSLARLRALGTTVKIVK